MIEACFDESENSQQGDLLVVSGYVANADGWCRFVDQWGQILTDARLGHFHMHSFRSSFISKKASLFAHLSEAEKIQLLDRLIAVIRSTLLFGVSVSVSKKDYNELTSHRFRSQWATAYTYCVNVCIDEVTDLLEESGMLDDVKYLFEDGHANASQAIEHLRRLSVNPSLQAIYKIVEYGLGPKSQKYGLQAADILAYCTQEKLMGSTRKPQVLPILLRKPGYPGVRHYRIDCNREMISRLVETVAAYYQERKAARSKFNEHKKLLRLARRSRT